MAMADDEVISEMDPHRMNKLAKVKKVGDLTPSIQSGTCKRFFTGAFYDGTKEPNKILAP